MAPVPKTDTFTCLNSDFQSGAKWGEIFFFIIVVWGLGWECYWRMAGRDR